MSKPGEVFVTSSKLKGENMKHGMKKRKGYMGGGMYSKMKRKGYMSGGVVHHKSLGDMDKSYNTMKMEGEK